MPPSNQWLHGEIYLVVMGGEREVRALFWFFQINILSLHLKGIARGVLGVPMTPLL